MKPKRATHTGTTDRGSVRLFTPTPKFWAETTGQRWRKSDGSLYPRSHDIWRRTPDPMLRLETVRPRTVKEIRAEIEAEIARAEQYCSAMEKEVESARMKHRDACNALDTLRDELREFWAPGDEVDE